MPKVWNPGAVLQSCMSTYEPTYKTMFADMY